MPESDLKISIVTPSLEQSKFLEHTIKSVLSQNYQNLEYVIQDGGSADGSVEIIQRYADRLTHWESKPDAGQYAAINEGFARTTGEIMGWLGSDDMYLPWTFAVVAEIFSTFPEVDWITSAYHMFYDKKGRVIDCFFRPKNNRDAFFKGENLPTTGWYATGFIQQESTFWRRSLWDKVGGQIDTSCKLAGDFDLWARFYKESGLVGVFTPLAGFRRHGDQKSTLFRDQYLREAEESLRRHGGRPRGPVGSYVRSNIVRFMPKVLCSSLGLMEPYTCCVNKTRSGEWTLVSGYDPDFRAVGRKLF